MNRGIQRHPDRLAVAAVLLAAWGAGVTLSSQRSTSSRAATAMTTAATKWLESLTPVQRQQATFANDAEEKVRWNFIPTNMFPRKGVPWKEMSEPQRKLAHELLKAGLSQKGYLTATANHGARDPPPCDRELGRQEGRERTRSRALLLHHLRRAVGQECLGLARRRSSPLAALHDRQQHRGRQHPGVFRHRIPRRCASKGRRRACASSARWRMRRGR